MNPTVPSWSRVVASAAFAHIVCSLPIFLTGTLAIRLREDLGIDEEGLGALLAMFATGAALAAPFMGRLAERLGPVLSLQSSCCCSGLAMILIGVTARDWGLLAALLVVAGISATLMQAGSNLFAMRSLAQSRMGLAFGLKQSGGPTAALLAGAAVPTVAIEIGWRWCFIGFGVLAIVVAIGIPRPQFSTAGPNRRQPTGRVVLGPLVVFTAGVAVGTAVSSAFTGFAVTAAVQQATVSEAIAGVIFAGGALAGIVVRVLLGQWADHRRESPFALLALQVGSGLIAFAVLATGAEVAFVIGVPLAFATAWGWVGLFHHAISRANANSPAAATGITLVGSNLGVIIGPALFGLAFARSHAAAWLAAGCGSVISGVLLAIGGRLIEGRADADASVRHGGATGESICRTT